MPAPGLKIDLLEIRQRDVEAFFQQRRQIKAGLTGIAPGQFHVEMIAFIKSLHQVKGLKIPEFTAAIAEFSAGLRIARERAGTLTGPETNGLDVRAAAGCGWLDEVTLEGVGDLRPGEVTRIASEIGDLLTEAYKIPGE